jgi:hypothetical protein
MNSRRRCLAAVAVATIAATGLVIAVAQAVVPPAGTPNLALMTLQPSDLAPGATIVSAYVPPGKKVRAQYDRNFTDARTTGGVALDGIYSELALSDSSTDAKEFFLGLALVYGSKDGRRIVAEDIIKGAGKGSKLTLENVHFGKLHGIGVGAESLLESITVHAHSKALVADVVALRVQDVVVNLTVVGSGGKLAESVSTALASAIAGHITTVLASSGATGPTGPTGATGATGPTG